MAYLCSALALCRIQFQFVAWFLPVFVCVHPQGWVYCLWVLWVDLRSPSYGLKPLSGFVRSSKHCGTKSVWVVFIIMSIQPPSYPLGPPSHQQRLSSRKLVHEGSNVEQKEERMRKKWRKDQSFIFKFQGRLKVTECAQQQDAKMNIYIIHKCILHFYSKQLHAFEVCVLPGNWTFNFVFRIHCSTNWPTVQISSLKKC